MAAITYRDIDNRLKLIPGATILYVNVKDFGILATSLDSNAVFPSHKKHIEYSPRASISVLQNVVLRPSHDVVSGDIVVAA
jgi:hypothetical protein